MNPDPAPKKNFVNIRVHPGTKVALAEIGEKGETDEAIILRLLDHYRHCKSVSGA